MKKFIFILLTVILFSCSTMLQLSNVEVKSNFYKNYKIGKVYQVDVGEPIILVRNDKTMPSFVVAETYQPPGIGLGGNCKMPILKRGIVFMAISQVTSDGSYIIFNKNYKSLARCLGNCINVDKNGNVLKGWTNKQGIVASPQGKGWKQGVFKPKKYGKVVEGSFKWEILYSGMDGNTLKAVYKEYFNNYARIAYSQELQWDISKNDIISYKGIKIKILDIFPKLKLKAISDDKYRKTN